MCGEQNGLKTSYKTTGGSSPRVRGTAINDHSYNKDDGIIPACAGNRRSLTSTGSITGDHPRVCGEQLINSGIPPRLMGSSPRVRGTDKIAIFFSRYLGIIPACAGNRSRMGKNIFDSRDHPRVCGEQNSQ